MFYSTCFLRIVGRKWLPAPVAAQPKATWRYSGQCLSCDSVRAVQNSTGIANFVPSWKVASQCQNCNAESPTLPFERLCEAGGTWCIPPESECHSHSDCVDSVCQPIAKDDGTPCDDGDDVTQDDKCTAGICGGSGLEQCAQSVVSQSLVRLGASRLAVPLLVRAYASNVQPTTLLSPLQTCAGALYAFQRMRAPTVVCATP